MMIEALNQSLFVNFMEFDHVIFDMGSCACGN